jgi:hypothetical protein
MLDTKTLAVAKGEVKASDDAVTPNVACNVTAEKDYWVIRIPKRIPGVALTPTQEKTDSKGNTKPPGYVFAKLQFPEIDVVAFGKDADGKDYEITFKSKPTNNVNLFYKIR